MNHDDEPMPDSLRSVIDVLRAPAPLPDDAADAPLRAQVRTMVRAMVPVLPDPPASSGSAAGPPKAPRGPWQRTVPLATFGAGLCVGAVLHAALATPQVRVVTRDIVGPSVVAAAPAPLLPDSPTAPPVQIPPLVAAPPLTGASTAQRERDGGVDNDGVDDARLREQLVRVEQLLDEGATGEALQRIRALDRHRVRSPALEGLREVLLIRALRASGDHEGARVRGDRYVARHPDSSYAREIRAVLGGPRK